MPYKDKQKDREWHKDYMKNKRSSLKMGVTIEKHGVVTPETYGHPSAGAKLVDADGNLIPEY